jgi:hypothetical protein
VTFLRFLTPEEQSPDREAKAGGGQGEEKAPPKKARKKNQSNKGQAA